MWFILEILKISVPTFQLQSRNRTIDDNTIIYPFVVYIVCIESINCSTSNKELGGEIYLFAAVPNPSWDKPTVYPSHPTHTQCHVVRAFPPSLSRSLARSLMFFPTKLKRNILWSSDFFSLSLPPSMQSYRSGQVRLGLCTDRTITNDSCERNWLGIVRWWASLRTAWWAR